jgi:prefoldin beta subunit
MKDIKEQEKKIQEMQILEQTLQNLLLQKQAFNMELSETASAMEEISNSRDEVFRIIGQLMIKTEKKKMTDELADKEKILTLRLKSIEKQESSMMDRLRLLKEQIVDGK